MPQLIRLALPGLSNFWLNPDEGHRARLGDHAERPPPQTPTVAVGATKQPLSFYAVAGLIYLLFSVLSSIGIWRIDAWASRGVKR